MAESGTGVLVHWVVAVLLIALVGESMAIPICNIDTDELKPCLPAVNSDSPPQPSKECCKVVRYAKLSCLCGYKSVLPEIGINAKNAMELPKKCHIKTPPECHWP